jgi:hypothetical protein
LWRDPVHSRKKLPACEPAGTPNPEPLTYAVPLITRLCLLAVLGLLSAACRKTPPTAASTPAASTPAPAIWPATRKTQNGNFTVTIRPKGGGIVRSEHFSLEVLVEPAPGVGAPVSVVVDADMPSHQHGMNTTPQTVHEDGKRYRTDGMLFHMAGEWSISVAVSAGKGEERAHFPVTLE